MPSLIATTHPVSDSSVESNRIPTDSPTPHFQESGDDFSRWNLTTYVALLMLVVLWAVKLNVLYWAGSLSALGSAIFLYLAGMRLSAWHVGWTAGAILLLQAFAPSLFCFPLAYSFSTVYGCLLGCLFLWLAIAAVSATN